MAANSTIDDEVEELLMSAVVHDVEVEELVANAIVVDGEVEQLVANAVVVLPMYDAVFCDGLIVREVAPFRDSFFRCFSVLMYGREDKEADVRWCCVLAAEMYWDRYSKYTDEEKQHWVDRIVADPFDSHAGALEAALLAQLTFSRVILWYPDFVGYPVDVYGEGVVEYHLELKGLQWRALVPHGTAV